MIGNLYFTKDLVAIATEMNTIYVYGGSGQKMTAANKLLFKSLYAKNRSGVILEGINNADANTRGYDCNCLIKSVINTGTKGGYVTKPCPDVNIEAMFKGCTSISENMDEIEQGEYLVYGDMSHCGVYVGLVDGKRCAVESTSRFKNGVQLIDIDCEERKGMWKYHGKLTKYIDYPKPNTETLTLKAQGDIRLKAKKGDQNDFVKSFQEKLFRIGYSYVNPVGYFGDDTEKAVRDFQNKNGISGTGVIDTDTYNALLKS